MVHRVTVSTFARLHLGFFDLSGQSHRRFGSMGVAIQAFQTKLSVENKTEATHSENKDAWMQGLFQHQLALYSAPSQDSKPIQASLDLSTQIPRHAGLGSGTQMALAIGCAMDTLLGKDFDAKQTALYHRRGGRSGIGIYTFGQGGLVLDGGHVRDSQTASVPPLIGRYAFPEAWQFILIEDSGHIGIHGDTEKQAFKTLKPQSIENTQRLNQQLMMETLPALIEADFSMFSQGLGALQAYNAQYFAKVQGGMFASQDVAAALNFLSSLGYVGLGQSSWGPTGFVLLPCLEEASACLKQLEQTFSATPLRFTITSASNQGASVKKR